MYLFYVKFLQDPDNGAVGGSPVRVISEFHTNHDGIPYVSTF